MCFVFSKMQNMSERIAEGNQQLKFERNPHVRYTDNCDTEPTDGRTNVNFISSADSVKQS